MRKEPLRRRSSYRKALWRPLRRDGDDDVRETSYVGRPMREVQRRDLRAAKGLRLRIGSNGVEERGGRTMPWGLQNRLARIIRPSDGHTVMLAADHGYFLGPTHKLEIPR